MAGGRPSKYTKVIADSICYNIGIGKSLREVEKIEGLPSKDTIRRWANDNPEFQAQYVKAQQQRLHHWADEIIDIADESNADYSADKDGNLKFSGEAVARSRLRVDTRKWIMSKLAPKKYGEKIEQTVIEDIDVKDMTAPQLQKAINKLNKEG